MKSTTKFDRPIISNDFVTCYADRLVIHLYYFPYGDKTIRYKDIQSCELHPIRVLGPFKTKTWGMALSPIWWHSDLRRHYREYCIILDTNHWPKIGITMDDNDINNVYELIKQETKRNQLSTRTLSKKKKIDTSEKIDVNMINSMSPKEVEYRNYLECDKEKYMDW
jgi:hypothetical protein